MAPDGGLRTSSYVPADRLAPKTAPTEPVAITNSPTFAVTLAIWPIEPLLCLIICAMLYFYFLFYINTLFYFIGFF